METDDVTLIDQEGPLKKCVVWCPLPLLTWMVPFIGHLGITDSKGIIHDFAGPYYINKHPTDMAFGPVCKYVRLNISDEALDRAIDDADEAFKMKMHNLLWNNCHSHVAHALNGLGYQNVTYYNTAYLMWFMVRHGHYTRYDNAPYSP